MFSKSQEVSKVGSDVRRLKVDMKTYGNTRRLERYKIRKIRPNESSPSVSTSPKKKKIGPPTVVLDNGGYTAKIGMSGDENPRVIPNCIMKVKSERKRFFIGNQIDDCRDLSGLYYMLPSEKGYITKWNVQKPVWDYLFNNICPVDDKPVIMTQPIFNFKTIQEVIDEIFFEEYEVKSLYRVNPTDLARHEYVTNVVGKETSCIVVDSGFSFTHIIPYIDGKKYYKACRRINVGGKVLTNYLKDIISYRQLHVMDETYVINQVKEDSCYVSLDFKADMGIASQARSKNTIMRNYVLPDFNTIRRGYLQVEEETSEDVAEGCQILRLNNERITVPELLFHPSDIGMGTMGIAETIIKSIKSCPISEQSKLAQNIVVYGGNANFPNFRERLYADVRSFLPDHWEVNVYKPDDPVGFAWRGGKSLADDPQVNGLLVTKEQYEENGSSYTYEKFSDWIHSSKEPTDCSSTENVPLDESILSNNNLTRFDLFGKHEPVAEEVIIDDDDSSSKGSEADRSSKDSSEGSKVENSKDDDADSNSVDLEGETSVSKVSRKSLSKIVETTQTSIETSTENDALDSYDFDIFDNSYL